MVSNEVCATLPTLEVPALFTRSETAALLVIVSTVLPGPAGSAGTAHSSPRGPRSAPAGRNRCPARCKTVTLIFREDQRVPWNTGQVSHTLDKVH